MSTCLSGHTEVKKVRDLIQRLPLPSAVRSQLRCILIGVRIFRLNLYLTLWEPNSNHMQAFCVLD